jgi:Flp pilus assembly protein TadD
VNRRDRRAQAKALPRNRAGLLHDQFAEAVRFHMEGRLAEAEALYRRILVSEPLHADSLHLLGLIAAQTGRFELAVALIGQALAVKPGFAEAHNNLGNVLQELGRSAEAAAAYRRAIALKGDYADAHNNLSHALRSLGQRPAAVEACRRAIALQPLFAEAYNNLGNLLQDLGRPDEALAAYAQALALKPDYAEVHVNIGITRLMSGEKVLAEQAVTQALAIDPDLPQAWYTRSDMKVFTPDDADIGKMEALLAAADVRGLGRQDRLRLLFALGKAWMDADDADRAFAHLDAGNQLKRASFAYAVEEDIDRHAAIARCFTPDVLSRFAGLGDASDMPVFIVGMPRSGTTLIEQILASHPQVSGAGELELLPTLVNDIAALPSAAALATIGQDYARQLAALAPDVLRVVDKMPVNFRHIGLIRLMLPNARIIHCRRDPIDTCLSCYTKNFNGQQSFAYDFRELGLYHRSYDALMQHWRAVLPADRFIEVNYEDVVQSLEAESQRLIAFCGLDWDKSCLTFNTTPRQVRTASVNQVRQNLYATSVGRWRPYARHLAPLLAALGV